MDTDPWERRLDGAFLQAVDFRDQGDISFSDFTLVGTWLSNAHLDRVVLHLARLEEVFLFSAHLERADLKEVQLTGADLRGADLSSTNLRDANV